MKSGASKLVNVVKIEEIRDFLKRTLKSQQLEAKCMTLCELTPPNRDSENHSAEQREKYA